ncbi:MAG: metallophosphoesterase family protein [Verrucomicrobia bacterium]|nr:metallophosphoesterase family protein [Verrucomicrobiota bacterium]MCH8511621.1 metallophosphatase family protein [Kiritimatiellia bacterium]
MKTLILSDIHANLIALETVWKREGDADLILCAGDIVDYGPHPAECVEWMMEKRALAVRGNHDELVVSAWEDPGAHEPETWRTDNAAKLGPRHVDYLKKLPLRRVVDLEGIPHGLTHAYQGYEIIRSLEEFHRFSGERFGRPLHRMIFGHTHRRAITHLSDEDCWMNPGSVSYRRPDEHWRGAHYVLIQDGTISLRALPYPTEALHREVLAASVCPREKEVTAPWWFPEDSPLKA